MPHYTSFRSAVMCCDECQHEFYVDLVAQPIRCPQCFTNVTPCLPSYQRMELFDALKLLPEIGDDSDEEEHVYKEVHKAFYGLSWYNGSRKQMTACWYEILHSDFKESHVDCPLRYLENVLIRLTLNL